MQYHCASQKSFIKLMHMAASGVTRGLRLVGQNLAEGGPLATVLVCNN